MNESQNTTLSRLRKAGTRAGLSILAYQGVALIFALILLPNSIDVAAKFFPLIAMSQVWAAFVWWSGAWLAPVLIDTRYQLRRWWLIGALGSCQTFTALIVQHAVLDRQPLSSLMRNVLLFKVTIIFILYGAVSALVYISLLRLHVQRRALADFGPRAARGR